MRHRPLPLHLGLMPVVLYVCFGIAAAFIVPCDYTIPRPTPPDEGAHLAYIAYLAEQRHLPIFLSPNDNYEAHQPPLYYVSALPAYWLGTKLFPSHTQRPLIIIIRLWSVLLAAISVWLMWLLGRRVFGLNSWLSLAPACFLALWPGRTMIVSAITNDGLAEALCLWTFLLCLILLQEGLAHKRAAHIGFVWSLALLTKSTALALGPVLGLALVMGATNEENKQEKIGALAQQIGRAGLIVGAFVFVIAGWWFIRNQILYGDPLAARAFHQLFKQDRATPEYFISQLGLSGSAYFSLVIVHTLFSFWGVYGQANVWNPESYYLLGFGIWLGALAGLVRQIIYPQCSEIIFSEAKSEAFIPNYCQEKENGKRKSASSLRKNSLKGLKPLKAREKRALVPEVLLPKQPFWRPRFLILSGLLIIIVIVFFLRFNTEFYQAQARYLFAANGPIVIWIVWGLWSVDRRLWGHGTVGLALAMLLGMSIWSVGGYNALVAAHYPPPFFGGL